MHDYDPCYYRSHSGFPDPCSCIYYSGTISIVGDLASGFETGLRRILPRRTHISGTSWLVPIGRCDAAENVNYIALSISDHYVSFCRPYRTLQNEVLCTRCTNDETSPSHTRTSGCWFGINIFYFIEASRPYVTVILKSFFSFFFQVLWLTEYNSTAGTWPYQKAGLISQLEITYRLIPSCYRYRCGWCLPSDPADHVHNQRMVHWTWAGYEVRIEARLDKCAIGYTMGIDRYLDARSIPIQRYSVQ